MTQMTMTPAADKSAADKSEADNWVMRHWTELSRTLVKATRGDYELAADVISLNYIGVCQRIPDTLGEYHGQRVAYLVTVARNARRKKLRKEWDDPINLTTGENKEGVKFGISLENFEDKSTPEVDPLELSTQVSRVIDTLHADAASLVHSYIYYDCNVARLSVARNIPESTVRTQVRNALAQLRQRLIDEGVGQG